MRVHLVSPRNPETFWTFDRILPILGRRCVFPNLALPTIAGLTPSDIDVSICDENVEPVDFDVEADIVGITGFIVHRHRMFELIAGFRRRGRAVVVGGPYATLCPEDFAGRVDVLFVGEAEQTWPCFLNDYAAGCWHPVYRASRAPDLEATPLPRYDLLRLDRYRSITMQFGRGCPFACEFCDITILYGRRPRTKPVEAAMREIEELFRLGVRHVFVVDDNFIGNKAVARELLRNLARWQAERGYPLELLTEASINLAQDPELMQLLHDANFTRLFIGIESPRHASLSEANKKQNLRESLLDSVERIQSYGMSVDAGMIVGFDSDDPSIFEEHARFIEAAHIPISMTGMLNALPKTRLHDRLNRAGRIVATSGGDQFLLTNIVPAGMTRPELYDGYRSLLERLYSFRSYRRRAMAQILLRGDTVAAVTRLDLDDIRILLRVLRSCLLGRSFRRAFMTGSMLISTALRRPSRIRDAVALALMHKHFYEYVEQISHTLRRGSTPPGQTADVLSS